MRLDQNGFPFETGSGQIRKLQVAAAVAGLSGSRAHIMYHIFQNTEYTHSHTTHAAAYEKNTHWSTLGRQKDIAIVGVGFSSHTTPQVFCVVFTYRTQGSM